MAVGKKSKFKRPLIARCHIMAGNANAGTMLYRLMAWKPTIERNGRAWIAKSYEELMFECAQTRKQVRTCIETLAKTPYVEIERHLFGGRNVNHFMLTPKFLEDLEALGEDAQEGTSEYAQTGTSEDAHMGTFKDAQSGASKDAL